MYAKNYLSGGMQADSDRVGIVALSIAAARDGSGELMYNRI